MWWFEIRLFDYDRELGKKMREESDRQRQLQEEGFKLKLQFIQEGKKSREEKKVSYDGCVFLVHRLC